MKCPKCDFENPADREDCLRCGVIFAKIPQRQAPQAPVPPEEAAEDSAPLEVATYGEGRTTVHSSESSQSLHIATSPWQWAVLVVLAIWGGKLVFSGIAGNAAGESWLHLINLPFHEAGHLFFRPLGRFITSLGGTLGQLLVPLVCMAALILKNRDFFGGAVCLWWFGENFLDIAPYINDARAGRLPLLGGNVGHSSPYGFHDWEYLLTETGLLRYDHILAKIAHGFGALLIVLAIVWGTSLLLRRSSFAKRYLSQ